MQFNSLSKLAMIAGLSISAFTYGAEKMAAPAVAAKTTAATAPAASAPAVSLKPAVAAKSHSFSGTVVSTDAIANTIVVKNTKGEETFNIAATGKISAGKKEVKLADVAKDQKVMVKYTEEGGAKTASSVKISAAATAKDPKTATAASPAAQ